MLDNLMEIEVAYSLLKSGDDGKDPIDASYEKLKTEIEVKSFSLYTLCKLRASISSICYLFYFSSVL